MSELENMYRRIIKDVRKRRDEFGAPPLYRVFYDPWMDESYAVDEDVIAPKFTPSFTPFPDDMKSLYEINNEIRLKIAQAMMIPAHLFHPRYADEPVIEHPQLRIPPDRWAYQYHVWTTPIRALRWLVAWLADRR